MIIKYLVQWFTGKDLGSTFLFEFGNLFIEVLNGILSNYNKHIHKFRVIHLMS